jgi:coronin-1B/1C/6
LRKENEDLKNALSQRDIKVRVLETELEKVKAEIAGLLSAPKKDDTEVKQEDTKQEDTKQEDTKQEDVKQEDAKQEDAKQEDSAAAVETEE